MESLNSILVILPPVLVLATAALFRHVILSLSIGIISAAFIASHWSLTATLTRTFSSIYSVISDPTSLLLFGFLLALGTLIELMTHAGGISASTSYLKKFVTTKRSAEGCSLLLSCVFMLDDYLNNLMTGSIIRPLSDSFSIPRVKLAFLLNSMSSPLCSIIPVTSWAAMILTQLQTSGVSDTSAQLWLINADSLITLLHTLPFIFYTLFIIISAAIIVLFQLSFGTMKQHEEIALKTGNLFGGKENTQKIEPDSKKAGSLSNFIIPIAAFIIMLLFFILWTGKSALLGGSSSSFIDTIKNSSVLASLLLASVVTLTITSLLYILQKQASLIHIFMSMGRGISLMKNSLIVLLLAFSLGTLINGPELNTGGYLAHLISLQLPLALLPVIIFILATVTTASTGSSWGTILVLMPLTIQTLTSLASGAYPLFPTLIPLLYPSLGALIAGAVAGAHLSPITDATVVSSMAARANHLDHVKTQISYSLPAVCGTIVALLITGLTSTWPLLMSWAVAFAAGLCLTLAILFIRHVIAHRKPKNLVNAL
ncbi:MAG: Na antiporter NhaC [candidate division TM6 bacterium GW2011_GWE2_42_60]|nr:MAG: Na antiporter NhaC [candidate division TM6 bacterium GW2011_GWE2_42_60]HBY05586.1 hypothetical protein [Candidatus Dependentiae bacterium]